MAETIFSVAPHALPVLTLGDASHAVTAAGAREWLLEIADGHFVPWFRGDQHLAMALAKDTTLPVWAHLRTERPERHLASLATAGCRGAIVQAEACVHAHRTLAQLDEQGLEVGVALCAATPMTELAYLLPLVTRVLLVCSEPSPGGERYVESAEERVRILAEHGRHSTRRLTVQVTGAMDARQAGKLARLGAHVVTVGETVFTAELSPGAAFAKFQDAVRVQAALA